MFSAGISADLEFRVDRSKRYNFYRDRRKQGDFAETVENATKQGDRINPDIIAVLGLKNEKNPTFKGFLHQSSYQLDVHF